MGGQSRIHQVCSCVPHRNTFRKGEVKWHAVDGKVDRRSFMGEYKIDPTSGYPLYVSMRSFLSIVSPVT
jgi:hypothetical protein